MQRLTFTAEAVTEIDELASKTGETRREFLNSAIVLYKWAILEREHGRLVASIEERSNTYTEVTTPALDRVKPVLDY